MNHKNHEESDLQCSFSHFRSHMLKFYHKIFFKILILRALDNFVSGVLLVLLIAPGQNRGKQISLNFKGIFLKSHLSYFTKKLYLILQ